MIGQAKQTIPIIGEVELASRFLKGKLVAITGSNGKTTTTALAGDVVAAGGEKTLVGGNIGTPAISLVPRVGYELYGAGDIELPVGDDSELSSAGGGGAECDAGSPGSAWDVRGLLGSEAKDLR